jgi:hypothetical protein
LLFANDYGIYALVGATTSKLSDALDGIYPLFDFTRPVTGGQVLLNNILCAAFQFWYNDPVQGSKPHPVRLFDEWFLTSQGSVNHDIFVKWRRCLSLWDRYAQPTKVV